MERSVLFVELNLAEFCESGQEAGLQRPWVDEADNRYDVVHARRDGVARDGNGRRIGSANTGEGGRHAIRGARAESEGLFTHCTKREFAGSVALHQDFDLPQESWVEGMRENARHIPLEPKVYRLIGLDELALCRVTCGQTATGGEFGQCAYLANACKVEETGQGGFG